MLFGVEQCAHQQVLTDCHARRCSSGLIVDADATCKVIGDVRSSCLSVLKTALLLLVSWLVSVEHVLPLSRSA